MKHVGSKLCSTCIHTKQTLRLTWNHMVLGSARSRIRRTSQTNIAVSVAETHTKEWTFTEVGATNRRRLQRKGWNAGSRWYGLLASMEIQHNPPSERAGENAGSHTLPIAFINRQRSHNFALGLSWRQMSPRTRSIWYVWYRISEADVGEWFCPLAAWLLRRLCPHRGFPLLPPSRRNIPMPPSPENAVFASTSPPHSKSNDWTELIAVRFHENAIRTAISLRDHVPWILSNFSKTRARCPTLRNDVTNEQTPNLLW